MTVREWTFGTLRVRRFCEDISAPVVYVSGDGRGIETCGWTVISVEGIDWNRDLTPWPAKAVFRGRPDFGGGAGEYLRMLTEEIIPAAEKDIQPSGRAVMGYSLAGLFAVYAALETQLFDASASVSGSMWYPGFSEYVAQKENAPECAYFSVGDREKLSRSAAFRSIEECTHAVTNALGGRGTQTVFELNPGGHFDDAPGRMRRALEWMNREFIPEKRRMSE